MRPGRQAAGYSKRHITTTKHIRDPTGGGFRFSHAEPKGEAMGTLLLELLLQELAGDVHEVPLGNDPHQTPLLHDG